MLRPFIQPGPKNTDNRPYILFYRKKNTGLMPRPEREIKSGKQAGKVMPAFAGEQWEEWRCSLVAHKAPNDPFTWVTKDWLMSKISADCYPIGFGNMDKIPASYPAEWRGKLDLVIEVVQGMADVNKKRVDAERALAEREAAFEAKVKAMEENTNEEANGSGQAAGDGIAKARAEKAPRGKGAAAATL